MNCWRKLCAICPKLVSKSATRCPWTSKNAQPVEMLGAFLTSKFRHCFGIILRVWAVPAVILTFLRVSDVQLYYSHHSWYRQFHPKMLVSARWYQCQTFFRKIAGRRQHACPRKAGCAATSSSSSSCRYPPRCKIVGALLRLEVPHLQHQTKWNIQLERTGDHYRHHHLTSPLKIKWTQIKMEVHFLVRVVHIHVHHLKKGAHSWWSLSIAMI